MSELAKHSEEAYAQAEREGFEVVVPDEYTLQLDIDQPNFTYANNVEFAKLVHCLDQNFGVAQRSQCGGGYDIQETVSPGGNTHITIRLKKPVDATQRILLQACLGSDSIREMLSFFRILAGDKTPTLFFEAKE